MDNHPGHVPMGNEVVFNYDIHYFKTKWGEDSKPFQRASKLLKILLETTLPKIKHNHSFPDKFGFEADPSKPVRWMESRDFVENVVESYGVAFYNKSDYRNVVNYLIKEGAVSRTMIKVGYYDVSDTTFDSMYQSLSPERKRVQEELALQVVNLDKAIREWKRNALAEMYSRLEGSIVGESLQALLENPRMSNLVLYEFFDPSDVQSLKQIANSNKTNDMELLVRKSSFGKRMTDSINNMISLQKKSV